MTVDELIKLWREYREWHKETDKYMPLSDLSFDSFINWLERKE